MIIRHIAASESTSIFAVAAFEHDVVVWDYSERRKIASLNTILDFGGRRLGIYNNNNVSLLITGAYNRYGVCAYDISLPDTKTWWRRDLKNPQVISVSEKLGLILSSFEYGALKILDAVSGENILKISAADKCYFGPRDDEIILIRDFSTVRIASIKTGRKICELPVQCGALDIAHNEDEILLADMSATSRESPLVNVNPARLLCYSRDGRLLWQHNSVINSHFLSVAWCSEMQLWFAIEWPYMHGGPQKLKALNKEGKLVHETTIGKVIETEFFMQGQALITSSGEILELPNLNVLWRFEV